LPIPIASRVFPALSCNNFKVSGLILRLLIHCELIQGNRHGSSFSFLQAYNDFSQQHFLKRLSFLHHMFLVHLSKIKWAQLYGFMSRSSILFHWSSYLFCASIMLFSLLWIFITVLSQVL
jgi:hypothetical protein